MGRRSRNTKRKHDKSEQGEIDDNCLSLENRYARERYEAMNPEDRQTFEGLVLVEQDKETGRSSVAIETTTKSITAANANATAEITPDENFKIEKQRLNKQRRKELQAAKQVRGKYYYFIIFG